MKKSARQLGDMLGKTAQEVNLLLKEHGYLDGTPGDYYVTEKGKSYAEERFKDNGYGGYAARSWSFTMWDEEIAYIIGDPEAHAEKVKMNRKLAGLD